MDVFGVRQSMDKNWVREGSRSVDFELRNRKSVDAFGRSSRSSTLSGADKYAKGKKEDKEFKSTFVDANAMKEKVRQNLSKPQHSVRDYYHTTGAWQAIAKSSIFEYISLAVVGTNSLWIAVDTDLNNSDLLLDAHPVFQFAENAFCACFFLEWLCRFMAFKRKRDGMRDAWFMFDSFMVFMMVMETWVMTAVLLIIGGSGAGAGNASILRIARLLRLSRMARMARLLRALPELMIMIRGMVAATRSVFFTLCLLVIVIYIFAIAFTQLCAGSDIGVKYFNTVPDSMFTLLIYGTLLDNIGQLAKEIGRDALPIAVIFFLFVLIAALTVMNMLIGVLCEVVNAVAATEKEEMLVSYVNQKLQRVVSLLDADGGGTISKKEFLQILENIDAVRCLQDVGVDVIGLVDFADFIFQKDDGIDGETEEEEDEVELDFAKFMDVVLQLRGTNNATVKDIVDLRKFVRNVVLDLNKQINRVFNQMEQTRHTILHGRITTNRSQQNVHPKAQKAGSSNSVDAGSPNSVGKVDLDSSDQKKPNNELVAVNNSNTEKDSPPAALQSYHLEGGGLPSPVQPSVPVHLLRLEEVLTPQDSSDEVGVNGHAPTDLIGQWYPYDSTTMKFHARSEITEQKNSPRIASTQSTISEARLISEPKGVTARPHEATEERAKHRVNDDDPFLDFDSFVSQKQSSL